MALINMAALRAGLGRNQRLIGVDPGRRRIGLALSDVLLGLATPAGSLPRGKLAAVAAAVGGLARQEDAGGLVVGLPLSMDGTFGPAAQAARDWGKALSEATGLPAAMWDERMTSVAANDALTEAGVRGRRRAAAVDGMAAAFILQAALDETR